MRSILDRLFTNCRVAIIAPLVTAVVMYLLFVLFGQVENKLNWVLMVPVGSVIWYGALYFALRILVKFPSCPAWLLDILELAALAVYGYGAVSLGVQFLMNMALNFEPSFCTSIISWSAIALFHGKRK